MRAKNMRVPPTHRVAAMIRLFLVLMFVVASAGAQPPSEVAVFWERGFPFADTGSVTHAELSASAPGATFAGSDALPYALLHARTLVLPYGSAFPENA